MNKLLKVEEKELISKINDLANEAERIIPNIFNLHEFIRIGTSELNDCAKYLIGTWGKYINDKQTGGGDE